MPDSSLVGGSAVRSMIQKAAEHGRRWDNPMSGSAPWTIDRNPSQVEAYRHHVL